MSTKQSCQVHFHHQGVVVFIVGSSNLSHPQLISCVQQSKNLEETLVQLCELQEPTPPPIVSSGRVDVAGSIMDIAADSCKSLLDQFLQEREPTALAEGGIMAVIDPHNNVMNQFLNEWEPTAPPVDGMNMDLLKQLLNVWEPSALPVTHEKLNRMDGSSTPAQDITMQVDFLADLQNDMREPMPPPLVSNVPIKSFDLAADEDNGANHLTFGMSKRSEMRDHFEEICNGELPSAQQSLQMEQWGLAPVPHCNQVLCTLHTVVSCYCRNTTPSDTLFNPTLDRHLVWAVNAISVVEMGILYLACQIEVASVHLKQTANITGWHMHWFAILAMDLLNSLILVMVLHASYTPPLPVCYHAYLRHQDDELIPLSTFCIINNISAIILHWTPHAADPNSGFAFPWWLYCSEEYAADSQRLQAKGLFSAAWDFFKLMMAQGLWPLPEVPIADHLNGHIKEQKYANVVNGQGQQIDHFYARWWALHGLLGMPLQ
ncbi:hypothetical protein F5J12DRAFT_784612 [Pisolithus orientalis]|uniref:uncharacterized protein n=1 Tax=Pisolithus orientalis TaxID=936130 RepID=UPI002225A2F7|nr:uncharacterized protein F5J12DRAFT_784612 [Pisolithus orientalis]KAI5999847.1 hypothetical protein F5J12DRAFT_784612 [Pisolithus orientalis]